ncbi:MAG: ATP-binding protein [Methylococcales bacterium]|nr:ATP-binding protein [Methylococcales bacterium]
MNHSLQFRISLFYGLLFTIIQVLVFTIVFFVSKDNVLGQLNNNLISAEKIFYNLIAEHANKIATETHILASDFAFLGLVHNSDLETVRSSIENLSHRINGQRAFLIGLDKTILVDTARRFDGKPFFFPDSIQKAQQDRYIGNIALIEGYLYELVLVPVLAPTVIGWVAIGVIVDNKLIDNYKNFSSENIEVSFVEHTSVDSRVLVTSLPDAKKRALIDQLSLKQKKLSNFSSMLMTLDDNIFLSRSQRLLAEPADANISVILQMNIAKAMQPYMILFYVAIGVLFFGIAFMLLGGVLIAKRITQPLRVLSNATQRISEGQFDQLIPVVRNDELGIFADNFNIMTFKLKLTLHDLEELNVTLEKKVEQRTLEYKHVNNELSQTMVKLNRTQKQLIQLEKMTALGQLVAGIAHEINNPMSIIVGNLKPLEGYLDEINSIIELSRSLVDGEIAQKLNAYITQVNYDFIKGDLEQLLVSQKFAAKHVCDIVLALRNFSRLDQSNIASVNIDEGIDSALKILIHEFKERILIKKDYALTEYVQSYIGELNQVFFNILSNAIQSIPDEGFIFITTAKKDDQAIITFTDTGVGMTDKVKERMFDPFYTTKDVGSGTGLGLSISHGIVEKHGGTITVESVLGRGTRFTIVLPLSLSLVVK